MRVLARDQAGPDAAGNDCEGRWTDACIQVVARAREHRARLAGVYDARHFHPRQGRRSRRLPACPAQAGPLMILATVLEMVALAKHADRNAAIAQIASDGFRKLRMPAQSGSSGFGR